MIKHLSFLCVTESWLLCMASLPKSQEKFTSLLDTEFAHKETSPIKFAEDAIEIGTYSIHHQISFPVHLPVVTF